MRVGIIGGAGFIGINVAKHHLDKGDKVTIFDNFSRVGTRENVHWLSQHHQDKFEIVTADIRTDHEDLSLLADRVEVLYHLAGQVTVTESVKNPREDFECNALGTLNVLEAVRLSNAKPIVLYSSTNKVYGKLDDLELVEHEGAYRFKDLEHGVSEKRSLDFHSPYGCSKGTGDQYVIDYSRIYGLKTVVFRQSCIYGGRQFGIEGQGWVAWFASRLLLGEPLNIFGNGIQTRDVLFVDDLIHAYEKAIENIDVAVGSAYNVGGGPENTFSLINLIKYIEEIAGKSLNLTYGKARPGDQLLFISDNRKALKELGWKPEISKWNGVKMLMEVQERNIKEIQNPTLV